ncbi:MAG: GTPase HflX [Leptospiraceae bacterium]|nr:GTPase HflX [Leptospiraceae bacterium]MDW8307601.1 GTPase HflX [Leptospiraceae bacterium]
MDASSFQKHSRKNFSSEKYIALLVGQYGSPSYPDRRVQEESLRELHLLCDTAGVSQMIEIFVHVQHPDPAYFFTEGMRERFAQIIKEENINLLVADVALKPNQLRNLEEELKVRVIGRIELILDIFAMRAKTRTAALQVEHAQLSYILPRLKGLGGVLSRLGGGIGTRGPGESMLETDRRHIRRRLQKIEEELRQLEKHRQNTRKNRNLLTFALAGYTNAGKTSLLNRLSNTPKPLLAEDRLFATLDSFSRKVYLGDLDFRPLYCMVTDTVGFIRNLPASLVAAFSSTLEELSYSDVLILVLDASSPQFEDELMVVKAELERLRIADKPQIWFMNKSDLVFPSELKQLRKKYPHAVWGNTLSKEGVRELKQKMRQYAEEVYIPQKKAQSISKKHLLY